MTDSRGRKTQHPIVVLSGGWGYGNLGDDAILVSAVKLICEKLPQPVIRVITCDEHGAADLLHTYDNVTIHPSIHRQLFSSDQVFYVDTKLTFKERIRHGLRYRKNSRGIRGTLKSYLQSPEDYISTIKEAREEVDAVMTDADMYLHGGGGYINDWVESDIVKHIECIQAKQHGLRMMMMGQTIGPFSSKDTLRIGQSICSMMDGMFFRDSASIADCCQKQKALSEKVPDLALYEHIESEKRDNSLLFIPFNTEVLTHLDFLTLNLKSISEKTRCRVVVTVTQLWQTAIDLATACFLHFRQAGINVELTIPHDVASLQELIASSQLLISQNLHGLILGYRSDTRIISINTARKFEGFMDKVGMRQYMLDLGHADGHELSSMALELLASPAQPYQSSLADEIAHAFNLIMSMP